MCSSDLEALNLPKREPVAEVASGGGTRLATDTGGISARVFLTNILAARPGAAGAPVVDTEPEPVTAIPPEPTPLEEAFGAGDGETQAAVDDSPLASVFEGSDPEQPADDPGGEGMSFDQFFRTDETEEEPAADDKSDDEDFKNWLQGLKS